MDIINRKPGLAVLVAFIAGLIIGLVVFGWWLFPVTYNGADPSGLFPEYQQNLVRSAADLYSMDLNQEKLVRSLGSWGGDKVACEMARNSRDSAEQQRLIAAAAIVNGTGCLDMVGASAPGIPGATPALPEATQAAPGIPGATPALPGPAGEEGKSSSLPLFLLGLLLALLLAAIVYIWKRRQDLAEGADDGGVTYKGGPGVQISRPDEGGQRPAAAEPYVEPVLVPVARFHAAYKRGNDNYNDQFNIENSAGQFLGECGVSISETLGSTSPSNVIALEIWLFDKNDYRNITKVIMSDHVFYDEALQAKLAPKGEPILARVNETIVLETSNLILNAEIFEIDYENTREAPPNCVFERLTMELSVWVQGDLAGNPQPYAGNASLLDY